ncbi:MAG: hypothetical protein V4547_18400 [Bacteroidota bacterium]
MNFKRVIVEAQLCRLVEYFCEFDPRLLPVLTMARYWSIVNDVKFGQDKVPPKTMHQCLPEPYCLDWLIVTFFIHTNYLPTVRSILERPHRQLIERGTITDVGFSADPEYSREWKN